MRRPIIAGNWKMNKTIAETMDYLNAFEGMVKGVENVEIVLAPPFISLPFLSQRLKVSNIQYAGQNLHWEDKGAFTGEISPLFLKETGCQYVIIGHSERRHIFKETHEEINKKILTAIKHGIRPIFCIGETLKEREDQNTFTVIDEQITEGLKGISIDAMKPVVIAYEPVWAIGTGRNATSEQAAEVHIFIRKRIAELFDKNIAEAVRILYGGSVTPDNISSLISQPDIDGALVGGASLKPDLFYLIIENTRKIK